MLSEPGYNALSTGIAFALLVSIVAASFAYVHFNSGFATTLPPRTAPGLSVYLGINGTSVTPAIAEAMGLPAAKGFLIQQVAPGSPADEAGLNGGDTVEVIDGREFVLGGDVIVAVDSKEVTDWSTLAEILRTKSPGDRIAIEVIRDGRIQQVTATLGERP